MAESGDSLVSEEKNKKKRTRRRNHIPKREMALKEIHRLIVEEGLSNTQLCERLQIPKRTLERYLHQLFQEDNDLLLRPTAQDISTANQIFIERLLTQRQHLLQDIAYNANEKDTSSKVAAHELACDMIYAVKRLSVETAADVVRHSRNMGELKQQPSSSLLLPQSQEQQKKKGLVELRLVKNEKQLPSHYEVVADDNNNNHEKQKETT